MLENVKNLKSHDKGNTYRIIREALDELDYEVFDDIIDKKPDAVLVALGIPHQELLIYDNLDKFDKGIFVGVGGSFDVLSGMKKRAPKFFIKFHLEWLYRICREPKRMKRFFKSNVKYLFEIRKEAKKVTDQ